MQSPASVAEFAALIQPVLEIVGSARLDQALARRLNEELPPSSNEFRQAACRAAIEAGWMCERSAGGIRYGRVIKPGGQLGQFSVDVVEMADVVGPAHAHPNGEIDMIMPLDAEAKFDGHAAGWLVYGPGSRHAPTVTNGKALILYLLPAGAIDFKLAAT